MTRTVRVAPHDEPVEPDEQPSSGSTVDRASLATGIVWVVRGIAITSIGLPLSYLEGPWQAVAPVFGPLGAVAVLVGVLQLTSATPRTPWRGTLRLLAALDVPLRIATEVASAVRADVAAEAAFPAWTSTVQLTALGVTIIGVVCLARHLQLALTGIAADRWRQVLFGWVATLIAVPLAMATRALELFLVAGSIAAIAAALLVLSLLATYRAAEDDTLDQDFARR